MNNNLLMCTEPRLGLFRDARGFKVHGICCVWACLDEGLKSKGCSKMQTFFCHSLLNLWPFKHKNGTFWHGLGHTFLLKVRFRIRHWQSNDFELLGHFIKITLPLDNFRNRKKVKVFFKKQHFYSKSGNRLYHTDSFVQEKKSLPYRC